MKNIFLNLLYLAGVFLICAALPDSVSYAEENLHHDHEMNETKPSTVEDMTKKIHLPDLPLIDQEGNSQKFKTDIIASRLVALNFIYTRCEVVCPIQTLIFSGLQERLGERLGRDVFLVSITIDPAFDTPERLKAYANKHKAGKGWLWLTGDKTDIDRILLGMGVYSRDIKEHPSVILLGDGRHGGWTRYYGPPSLDELISRIDQLQAVREGFKKASGIK